MADISVKELKERLDKGEKLAIIDVREPHEYQAGNIGGVHIPLGSLPTALANGDLDDYKEGELILMCRSGGRSGSATQFLKQNGFANPRNLTGGITAWKSEIDPAITVA